MTTIRKIAAIVIKNNEFLLVRKKGKDVWTSLGGKPEGNETEEETLKREVEEELNCGFKIIRKLLDVKDKAVHDDAQVHLSFYLGELQGNPEIIDNELEEFTYIPSNYKEMGIKIPPSLENQAIPFCIKEGLLSW